MEQIKLDSVTKRFEDHLKINDNYRIILSGKFGIGKTFFLKEFFNSKAADYNAIFINPVNYVVSPNEDIFELIKVDIIKQLYTVNLQRKKLSVSVPEKVALFASEKPQHFLKFITSAFKKINPFVEIADDTYDALSKLYSEYKEYEKSLEEKFKITEEKIQEFTASFGDKTGSIFEEDFITKAIKEKLLETKKGMKRNVLVIDDLDRIDPEHVFRILNILSAHNDSFGSKNKFGFDYIIIVCDNDNIKNIFFHKYGEKVDYDGYIDKFFSAEIFKYENDEALKFYLKSTFIIEKDTFGFVEFTLFILNNLIDKGKLTVRKIIKHQYEFEGESFVLYEQKGFQDKEARLQHDVLFIKEWDSFFVDSKDLQILRLFRLLSIIYGDFNQFYDDLEDLIKIQQKEDADEISHILSFLAMQKHISEYRGDRLFFKITSSKNYREQTVLSLDWPEISFFSKQYRLRLNWTQSNPYDGSTSYFSNAQAVDIDKHQYLGTKPKPYIESAEIFKTLKEIINQCNAKGYLYKSGIILKI